MNKALQELTEIHYGKSPKGIRVDSSEYPIFGTGGQVGYAVRPLFKAPGIVVGRKGTLGNPIFSPYDFWAIDTTYAVLPKSAVEAKWIYYNLLNYDLTKLNEATGVPSINRDYLYQISFCDFEQEEQRKIAEILTTVDDAIEQTEALIRKYQRIKQGLMQDLLTRGVDENGEIRPLWDYAPRSYLLTEVGYVPVSWKSGSILDLVNFNDKNSIKPGPFGSSLKKDCYVDKGYKVYGQEQVIANSVEIGDYFIDKQKYKELSNFQVKTNDILISLVGTTGKVLIIPEQHIPGIINPRLLKISVDLSKTIPEFVAYLLTSSIVTQQLRRISHGLTMEVLNKGTLLKVRFGIPKLDEQKRIVNILSETENVIRTIENEHKKLGNLKQGLMQDLLTGKVRVNALLEQ